MTGDPPHRSTSRGRGGARGRSARNAQYGITTPGLSKRRAADVVSSNPEWFFNSLDCAQQIARHQVITLTDVPPEIRAAITAAITATVHHCKTPPIPTSEGKNPLGRRSLDTNHMGNQSSHPSISRAFDSQRHTNAFCLPTIDHINKALHSKTAPDY